jgi:phage tail-like protein
MLKRTTEMLETRHGGDVSSFKKSPGAIKFEPIELHRGITHDIEFEQWANKTWNINNGFGAEVSPKGFRKNFTLEMYNEAGQVVLRYNVFRAWVAEYTQVPELDATSGAIAIETIIIEHEGFVRDYDLMPPEEPEFFEPAIG